MAPAIHPVILCGGTGTRLWPMSRQLLPKQFLPLVSERTMLQETVERLRGLSGAEPPTVVSNSEHRFLVAEQLREIGTPPRVQILEPIGRNTAPAVAVAALALERADPDAVMLVLPADHLIRDVETFHVAVLAAAASARAGFLTTFGIRPDHAATGYGYIEGGEAIAGHDSCFASRASSRSPTPRRAQVPASRAPSPGTAACSSSRARRYLEELERLAPAILAACRTAVAESRDRSRFRAPGRGGVRRLSRRFDRLCGDGEDRRRGRRPGGYRLERRRLVGDAVGGRREGRERQRGPRRRPRCRRQRTATSAPRSGMVSVIGLSDTGRRRDRRRGARRCQATRRRR